MDFKLCVKLIVILVIITQVKESEDFKYQNLAILYISLQTVNAQKYTGPLQIQLSVLESKVGKLQQQIMELIKSLTGFDLNVSF
jgi:hypothetical protein